MKLARTQDDLEALKYSHLYDREDEIRKSTGSIYGDNPGKLGLPGMHVRSNSDTSEINVALKNSLLPENLIAEARSPTGESFFALVRKFESIQNEPKAIVPEVHGATFPDGSRSKTAVSSATSSPSIERKTPVLLRRKNSLKGNSSFLNRMLKSSGETKGAAEEDSTENTFPRKAFAHYDCQSISLDFDELAKLRVHHGDGLKRKNTRSGASAASAKKSAITAVDRLQRNGSDSSASSIEEAADLGDDKSNELVQCCPFFRNELGGEDEQDPQIGLSRDNAAFQNPHDPTRPKEPKLDNKLKRRSTLDILLTAYDSARHGNLSSGTGVTILDNSRPEGGPLFLGERAPIAEEEAGKVVFEHVDHGSYFYRNFFYGQEHQNYLGLDEKFGAVAVSLRREKLDETCAMMKGAPDGQPHFQYRLIVRSSELTALRGSILEDAIPSTSRHGTTRALPAKDIMEHICPELQLSALRLTVPGPKVPEQLLKLDEQGMTHQYKVGILYCKAGQSTEEEMYNNQVAGPPFEEFLDLIGERVNLKGFEGYRAQLDNRSDSTGEQSVYTRFNGREIMFHVSTLLPWTPNNRQQLLRKRHIGNDIVTIVFQEPGAEPFTPKNIRSHFQHVFIVVRVYNPCSENTYYRVAVSRSRDVPPFGPPIPAGAKFGKQEAFANFLLAKVINAENAAHKSEKFSAMAARTRHEYLKDLATNNVTSVPLDSGGKAFGKFLSNKKKEKVHPPISPEKVSRGSLVWHVQVEDYRNSTMIECTMGISADTLVLVDSSSKQALFSIPTKAIIGWTSLSQSIKVFYGSGDCLVLNIPTSHSDAIPEIVRRLEAVSNGCQTQTLTLRRNHMGQLGFHVQYEGLIKDVEPNGNAWQAGLRHGCRLVEINGLIVATLSHEQMIDILRRPGSVMAVIVPPLPNGKPRKGVQQSGQPWWSNRSSTATISSCYSSASSVNDDQESRDHSLDRKIPPKVAPKKFSRGKESPWIMRQFDGVEPRDNRPSRQARDGSPHSTPSGSNSSLNDDQRYQSHSYGASYTVTSVGTNDVNGHSRFPSNYQETQASSGFSQNHPDKRKWSGFVKIDNDPKAQNTVGVTLAPTASGTFIALASTSSTPPSTPKPETPLMPDTPIFGSFSQRPDGRQHRRLVVSDPTLGEAASKTNGPSDSPVQDGETQQIGNGISRADGQAGLVPFKETSLGAEIRTTETYKEKRKGNYEDLTEASMSETMDQIEKAFGFKAPEMIDSPRRVITPNMGSLERGGSLGRRKKSDSSNGSTPEPERNGRKSSASPRGSLQDLQISDGVRPKFGEKNFVVSPSVLPQAQKSADSLPKQNAKEELIAADSILMRLASEMTPTGRPSSTPQGEENGWNSITTVVDASRDKAEVKKEIRRKSEYEARVAARNLIIERLESHKQSLEGDGVEGLKIYHAKSRSTPAEVSKNRKSPKTRHTSSQDDIHTNVRSPTDKSRPDDVRKSEPLPRRRRSSEIPVPYSSKDSRTKPVVRSERKINLSSPTSPKFEKSMSLPQHKVKRRHRHPAKQPAQSESDEETPKAPPRERHRKSDSAEPKPRINAFKRTASLPREHGASAIPRPVSESRSHRSHIPQLKGARITKLRVSAKEEAASPSLVDQTTRLLSASQDIKYEKGALLVVAEDVLQSLTKASDLLHSGTSREEREDKERERKDRSLAKSKSLGRSRSHGPHKFYIPVVPRRHSFDERIFASSTAKSSNKESSLTRESIGKEAELEMKLAIVSNALMKEGEERQRIENDLKRSQKENKRLQEDLRTASGQLRKFTEWFFHSVELNTT